MPSRLPPLPPRRWLPLAVALAAVGALTLRPDPGAAPPSVPPWCVVCGDYATADLVANVALFVPLGVGLALAGVRLLPGVLLAALATGAIELAQATILANRYPSTGDLLANALGGTIGLLLARHARRLVRPTAAEAGPLAAGAAALVLLTGAATAWALGRDAGPGPATPVVDPTPLPPAWAPFPGTVLAATVPGRHVPGTGRPGTLRLRTATPASFAATVTVAARRPAGPPAGAPILYMEGRPARPEMILGARGDDAMVAARLRTAALRLRGPSLRAAGALAAADGGARVLEGAVSPSALALAVTPAPPAASVERREWRLPLHGALGWALLLPWVRADGAEAAALGALWVAALVAPFGYWTAAALRRDGGGRGGRWVATALLGGAVSGLGLGLVPVLLGRAPTPLGLHGVAAAAALLAALAADAVGRRPAAAVLRDAVPR